MSSSTPQSHSTQSEGRGSAQPAKRSGTTIINQGAPKWMVITNTIVMILTIIAVMIGCSRTDNSEDDIRELRTEVQAYRADQQRAYKVLPLIFELQGYRISARLVYDENNIVRNNGVRPDDVLRSYDLQEQKIEAQIDSVETSGD